MTGLIVFAIACMAIVNDEAFSAAVLLIGMIAVLGFILKKSVES